MKEKEKLGFVASVTLETPAPGVGTSSAIHTGPTYQHLPPTLQGQQPSQASVDRLPASRLLVLHNQAPLTVQVRKGPTSLITQLTTDTEFQVNSLW